MKKLLFGVILAISTMFMFSSCEEEKRDSIGSPPTYTDYKQGNEHYVQVQNSDGSSFFMQYLLFHTLMNAGGYNRVNNYYYHNPNDSRVTSDYSRFNNYTKSPSPWNNRVKTSSYTRPVTSVNTVHSIPSKPKAYQRSSSSSSSWSSKPSTRSSSYSRSSGSSRSSSWSRSSSSRSSFRSSSYSRR